MVVNLEQGAAGDKTLLVVDDDRVIRGLVADVMGKLGYEVICVESAEEGVPILEKRMVSVALVAYPPAGHVGHGTASAVLRGEFRVHHHVYRRWGNLHL